MTVLPLVRSAVIVRRQSLAKMCTKKKVYQVDTYESDDYFAYTVTLHDEINTVSNKAEGQIFATMMVDGKPVQFQVDSGASCNIVPARLLHNTCQISKTT